MKHTILKEEFTRLRALAKRQAEQARQEIDRRFGSLS